MIKILITTSFLGKITSSCCLVNAMYKWSMKIVFSSKLVSRIRKFNEHWHEKSVNIVWWNLKPFWAHQNKNCVNKTHVHWSYRIGITNSKKKVLEVFNLNKEIYREPMSSNPMWIWACWPYPAQESFWFKVGYNVYLAAGGLLASYYLASFFRRVERRFHSGNRTTNHFIRKIGTSPLSPSSLGSS